MNIALCGMMGSGKTAVAKAYSDIYGVDMTDTDEIIVSRYGAISDIFAAHGEEYFRNIETEVCREVSEEDKNMVISLGGGCVLRSRNVAYLKRTCKVVYLKANAETIIKRLKGDNTRPLLSGDTEERVHTILAARSHIYASVADIAIDTDVLTPAQIAELIHCKL